MACLICDHSQDQHQSIRFFFEIIYVQIYLNSKNVPKTKRKEKKRILERESMTEVRVPM